MFFFIFFKKEKKVDGRGRGETAIGCLRHTPWSGIELATWIWNLTSNQTHNLSVNKMTLQPMRHTCQSKAKMSKTGNTEC